MTGREPHRFALDRSMRTDFRGRRFCLCGLPELNKVHTVPEPAAVPAGDVSDRWVGERGDR